MIIQIISIAGELVKTITVDDVPCRDVIMYSPCLYCETELVRAPKRFCCHSHRTLYWFHHIGDAKRN